MESQTRGIRGMSRIEKAPTTASGNGFEMETFIA